MTGKEPQLPAGFHPVPAPKPLPISTEPLVPWYQLAWWRLWQTVTWWPWQVRVLRKAGFVRTGWRTWEYPAS